MNTKWRERPPIPEEIKRGVRQRCGFGCIIWGMPLINYDHIIEWNKVHRHDEDNICLLCDAHHREKTNGLIALEDIHAYNREPYNVRWNPPRYLLRYHGPLTIELGGICLSYSLPYKLPISIVLAIDGVDIIWVDFEGDNILVGANIADATGRTALHINKNEVQLREGVWDFDFVGQRIAIRSAPRDIVIVMRSNVLNNKLIIERARFFSAECAINVFAERLTIGDNQIKVGSMRDNLVGITIGEYPINRLFQREDVRKAWSDIQQNRGKPDP